MTRPLNPALPVSAPLSSAPSTAFSLPAPAKINLFLHVLGRRSDGYHHLQTAFQFLDLADTLHFTPRHDGVITLLPNLAGVPAAHNLITKAAQLLQRETGGRQGADIVLEKRLPMGGGIGGGSSDAATALLGLNHLWRLNLPLSRLAEIGLQLGADVPVFVHGHAAWAEGVGEQLQPITPEEPWFVLLTPNAHISTAAVFNHADLTRHSTAITLAAFLGGGNTKTLRNDCENVVRTLSPEVDNALLWLTKNSSNTQSHARMSGTGACCYLRCENRDEAIALLAQSPIAGVVTQGMNRSSAHIALAAQRERIFG